jgi:hypothetical protein
MPVPTIPNLSLGSISLAGANPPLPPAYSGLPYPTVAGLGTIVPSATGGPAASSYVTGKVRSDKFIAGAANINPAYAADFVSGNYYVEFPQPGSGEPIFPKGKVASQTIATQAGPDAWKSRDPQPLAPSLIGATAAAQAPLKRPWNKKFIPPLALFNDASQWVNTLLLNQASTWFGAATSDPPLKAQYHSPPPINVDNFAAGTLNLQLQLGTIALQAQQLTIAASNYFGGT